jgi:hypothetical protein
MPSTQQRQFDDVALVWRFDGTRVWRILIECPMSPISVIIGQVIGENLPEVLHIENDEVVQALAPEGAIQAFDHWILPR